MRLFKFTVIPLLALLLFSTGCKKDKNGKVNVHVKLKYGTQDFTAGTHYTDQTGKVMLFSDFKFYLSKLVLIKTDNSEVPLSDIEFLDINNPTSFDFSFDNIKGDFKTLKFGSGVDSVQNALDPIDHPLPGVNDMYWSMLKYRFQVVEGKWNYTDSTVLTHPLGYHIGGDAFYRVTSLDKSFSVCCGEATDLIVYLDIEKIFYGPTETLNLPADQYSQTTAGTSEIDVATKFVDNFSKAFSF